MGVFIRNYIAVSTRLYVILVAITLVFSLCYTVEIALRIETLPQHYSFLYLFSIVPKLCYYISKYNNNTLGPATDLDNSAQLILDYLYVPSTV